jgi:ABC-type transport system involved in cytochrome bd biosynthesis fused ATPase/permease subunit
VEAAQRADEREAEAERLRRSVQRETLREARAKRVTSLAAAVVGGVALIGLFAALAAIPVAGGTFDPYVRAAFAALALGALVAGYAWLLEIAMRQSHIGHERRRRVSRILGSVLVGAGVFVSVVGWLALADPSPSLLLLALGIALFGVFFLTYSYESDVEGD